MMADTVIDVQSDDSVPVQNRNNNTRGLVKVVGIALVLVILYVLYGEYVRHLIFDK